MSVPSNWQRNIDAKLLGPRDRRCDGKAPHAREHRIEHDLLAEPINAVTCLGAEVIDGVNAVP